MVCFTGDPEPEVALRKHVHREQRHDKRHPHALEPWWLHDGRALRPLDLRLRKGVVHRSGQRHHQGEIT